MQEAPSIQVSYRKLSIVFVIMGVTILVLGSGLFFYFDQSQQSENANIRATNEIRILNDKIKTLSKELMQLKEQTAQKMITLQEQSAQREGALTTRAEETRKISDALAKDLERSRANESNLREAMESLNRQLEQADAQIAVLSKALGAERLSEIKKARNRTDQPAKESVKERAERLLKQKFTQISDDFTRPKVYVHDFLKSKQESSAASLGEKLISRLYLTVDGKIESLSFYQIQVLHDDEIVEFKTQLELAAFLKTIAADIRVRPVKCRLSWEPVIISPQTYVRTLERKTEIGDFYINHDHANALIETFEVADGLRGIESK